MTAPRNRAAQEATLINLRALKTRVAILERIVKRLVKQVTRLDVPRGWPEMLSRRVKR